MYVEVIWDLEDDPDGNYWHIVIEGHDVTQEEVVEILSDANNETAFSRSSGQAITFGWTSTGKYIAVVWEEVESDPRIAYPITAYPTNPPRDSR